MQALWIALTLPPEAQSSHATASCESLACWALGYTPRVARHDHVLLLEVGASQRLFGGRTLLLQRLRAEAAEWEVPQLALAPTALGAAALLATGLPWAQATPKGLPAALDALPLDALAATRLNRQTLQGWGCRRLGDVRRLPRDGLLRRLPATVLACLDQAYGHAPTPLRWLTLPERFEPSLSWPQPVEHAQGLVFAAQRLLRALEGWLRARHAGALQLGMEGRDDRGRTALTLDIGCSTPTQDAATWSRLLAEHLQRQPLLAPVAELHLRLRQHAPMGGDSLSLLDNAPAPGQMDWGQLVDRLSARLGAECVLQGQLQDDPRPLHGQQWQPVQHLLGTARPVRHAAPTPRPGARWEPTWLFDPPQTCPQTPSALGDAQPLATHWWDPAPQRGQAVLADDPTQGLLWLWQTPATHPSRTAEPPAWQQIGAYG